MEASKEKRNTKIKRFKECVRMEKYEGGGKLIYLLVILINV